MLHRALLALVLLSFLSSPALAGFKEGKEAYDRKKWVAAITELRPLAEAGDDRAMILLGNMYSEGFGVIRSYKEAMSLYRRAAVEKNNPEAMLAVAGLYTSGLGVPVNIHAAKQWFGRAALLGDQQGAFFYATILFQGNKGPSGDVTPDTYNSYKWFRIAAAGAQYPKIAEAAKLIAGQIAEKKLKPEEAARAESEAAAWKPSAPDALGPVPEEPTVRADAPPPESPDKSPLPPAPSPK